MITCKHCGTQMPDDATACPGCGADVTIDSATEPETTEQPSAEAGATESVAVESAAVESAAEEASPSPETTPLAEPPPLPARKKGSAPPRGAMSSTTKALIAAGVAVAVALGLIFWQVQARRQRGVRLTSEDLAEIVKSMVPPQQLAMIANDEKQRKEIVKDLRQLLAVAREARAAGIADKPETQRQIEAVRMFILARVYARKQQGAGVTNPDQLYSKEEVDNFLKEQGQEPKFEQFLKDVQELGLLPASGISDQQKSQVKMELWAPTQILARKAQAAGLDKERQTQLLIQLQEAQVLAQKYAPQLQERTKVSDQEVDARLAQIRGKAEDVLKRVRAGEDFGELAKQFGGDGTKDKGGDLGWFKRGAMVKKFEDAAFSLQPGQVSDVVETEFGFHVIRVDEKRTAKDDEGKDVEEVHARHILIKPDSEQQPNPFAPPPSLRDQVKQALEKEKREKLIEEIAERTNVQVAEDFKIEVPPSTPMPPPAGPPVPDEHEETLPEETEPTPTASPAKNSNGKK